MHTVNEPKTEKYRYIVMFLLDDLGVGDKFKPEALHLTVATWFVSDMDDEAIKNAFLSFFCGQHKIDGRVGSKSEFNYKRKIPINLLSPAAEISKLHKLGLEFFGSVDGRWAVKIPHIADDFIPHIRRRPGSYLKEGQVIDINSLCLVRASRQEDGIREVAAKVELG